MPADREILRLDLGVDRARALRREAARRQLESGETCSVAGLVREAIDAMLAQPTRESAPAPKRRAGRA